MKPPISEQDEFLLSRLLDNDLSPAEAEALRRRFETEPALAQAYARMTRLESLLKERRADQPQLDWSAFRARVINRVERAAEARASSPIIRLSRWLAIGVPLAAAAAIALVVLLHSPGAKTKIGPGPDKGKLVVVVDEPTSTPAPKGSIKVNFKRSQQLAEATWQADAVADEQPPSYVAVSGPEVLAMDLEKALMDDLPM